MAGSVVHITVDEGTEVIVTYRPLIARAVAPPKESVEYQTRKVEFETAVLRQRKKENPNGSI